MHSMLGTSPFSLSLGKNGFRSADQGISLESTILIRHRGSTFAKLGSGAPGRDCCLVVCPKIGNETEESLFCVEAFSSEQTEWIAEVLINQIGIDCRSATIGKLNFHVGFK